MMLPIYFFSGTSTSISYESYSCLGDIKHSLMNKLKLKVGRIPYFSMYEVLDKADSTEERILEEEEKVVNMKAMWDFDTERFEKNKTKVEFRVYLKLILYYGFTEDDVDSVTLSFYQAKYDIIQSKFNLSDDDISKLAAMQIVATYGNIPHEHVRTKLEEEIGEFVPQSKLRKFEKTYWQKTIMEEYVAVDQVYTKLEARKSYLDYIKNNLFYEAHLFDVKVIFFFFAFFYFFVCFFTFIYLIFKLLKKTVGNEIVSKSNHKHSDSDERLLALKPTGIAICDTNKDQLHFFEYTEICYWGYNGTTFIIVIPNQQDPNKFTKFYFESFQVIFSINNHL